MKRVVIRQSRSWYCKNNIITKLYDTENLVVISVSSSFTRPGDVLETDIVRTTCFVPNDCTNDLAKASCSPSSLDPIKHLTPFSFATRNEPIPFD